MAPGIRSPPSPVDVLVGRVARRNPTSTRPTWAMGCHSSVTESIPVYVRQDLVLPR